MGSSWDKDKAHFREQPKGRRYCLRVKATSNAKKLLTSSERMEDLRALL